MKKFLALGIGLAFSSAALAVDTTQPPEALKALPALPEDCSEQILDNSLYCSTHVIVGDKVTVTFAAIADKETFPTVESLLDLYLGFEEWPAYLETSPQTVIEFRPNGSQRFLPDSQDAAGRPIYYHYYDYSMKVQGIPFMKNDVRGVSSNVVVHDYEGALGSIEFKAETDPVHDYKDGLKGMKSQVGQLHALECTGLDICDDGKWLIIYHTTAQPSVSFAMGIAANTVKAGVEDLLIGLLAR